MLTVLGLLSPQELGMVVQVSRAFYVIGHCDELWRALMLKQVGRSAGGFWFKHTWKDTLVATLLGYNAESGNSSSSSSNGGSAAEGAGLRGLGGGAGAGGVATGGGGGGAGGRAALPNVAAGAAGAKFKPVTTPHHPFCVWLTRGHWWGVHPP